MSSSLFKYFGEQHDGSDSQKLFWQGGLSAPFRGPYAPTLTQDELDTKVEVQMDFHQRFFNLTIKEEADEYSWVMDRIVNGLFKLHYIDRHVDHTAGRTTVQVEWSQCYAQLSPRAKDARSTRVPITIKESATKPEPSLAGLQDPSAGI